jgi:hypothetical protein
MLLAVIPAGLAGTLMWLIIIIAIVVIGFIAIKAMGVEVPPWAVNIGWVVLIAAVAIFAIRLVLTL